MRPWLKRITSILCAALAALLLTTFCPPLRISADPYSVDQTRASEASALFYEAFLLQEGDYPADYAGCFLDDCYFYVLLVHPTAADIRQYRAALVPYNDCVRILGADFSLRTLEREREAVAQQLRRQGFTINGHGVDNISNSVLVLVDPDQYAAAFGAAPETWQWLEGVRVCLVPEGPFTIGLRARSSL